MATKKCPKCKSKVKLSIIEMASGMKDLSCVNCDTELQMNAGLFQRIPATFRVVIMLFIIFNARDILLWVSDVDFGSIASLVFLPFLLLFFFAEFFFLPLQEKRLVEETFEKELDILDNFVGYESTRDVKGAVSAKERQEAILKQYEEDNKETTRPT